jgi:predicted nucleic acid-binding Zn ribbon protein
VTRELRDHIRHERDRRAREGVALEGLCHFCLSDLQETSQPKRFCSALCRNADYARRRRANGGERLTPVPAPRPVVTCAGCKAELPTRRTPPRSKYGQRYCSDNCRMIARRRTFREYVGRVRAPQEVAA